MSKKKKIILIVSICVLALNAYIILHHNPLADPTQEIIKKVISCIILNGIYAVFLVMYEKIVILPVELFQNRVLIWKLAQNDFKTRYAGSYLGIIWAFVQPVMWASRSSALMVGVQRRASYQCSLTSSSPDQNPTAIPAA